MPPTPGAPAPADALNVRRPIGLKIFGISLLLLVMMIVVTILSSLSLRQVGHQITLLSDYYIVLDQIISDIRAYSLREATLVERVVYLKPSVPEANNSEMKAFLKDPRNCEEGSRRDYFQRLRSAYPDRPVRQWVNYRVSVQCTDNEIQRARALVEEVTSRLHDQPAQLARLAGIKSELDNIPPARTKLLDGLSRYLSQHHTNSDSASLALIQDNIDERRQEINRRFRNIARTLHEGTRESAALTKSLERNAQILSWSITLAACALGLLVAFFLTRNLVRPVRDLLGFTRAVRSGNLDVDIKIRTADEIALLADSITHMVDEMRQKEAIKKLFGEYVDPKIVTELLADSARLDHGDRQIMSVFFSDLEGYTAICEGLTPAAAVRLLNQYFSAMAVPIRTQNGIIDKFIGDSIMAFWGPPFCSPSEHAVLACYAALDQQALVPSLKASLPEVLGIRRNLPELRVRMAIASGEVTVGNIGASDARSFTVIGDNVNLASRLEGANKIYRTRILISEGTFRLADPFIEAREVDSIRVAGKVEPVRIYELMGRKGDISANAAQLRATYDEGLLAYRRQQWGDARRCFTTCLTVDPEDGPAQALLSRIDALQARVLPPDWDGVWVLGGK